MASGVVEGSTESKAQSQQTPGTGGGRSQLVQRLLDADNLPTFVNDLLTTQAIMVAGTEAAGFLIDGGAEQNFSLRPIAHIRPDSSDTDTRQAALSAFQELVKPCVVQGKDGAIEVAAPNDGSEAQFCLITLLRADGNLVAVSAVITRCLNLERARQRLQSMQLVAGYFELFTLRRTAEQSRMVAESHQHAMQLASAVATGEGFQAAAMGLCNELATRAGATRVSLGWMKGRNIKVKALSHTEDFDKKQELIVQLERVMEECIDQEQVVQFIPSGQSSDNVTRSAQALSRGQGGHGVVSIPLRRRADIIGVVTLEFVNGQQISPNMGRGLAVAVDLLAPQLFDRFENDRWLITKAGVSTKDTAKLLFGRQHTLGKIITLAIVGALVFVCLFKPMYHVSAPFEFAAITNTAVVAPNDAKIASVAERTDEHEGIKILRKIKPGDFVKEGDVLVTLDTTEAGMKLTQAMLDRDSKQKEFRALDALSDEQSQARAKQIADERDKAQAEMDYWQYQIDKSQLKAPISGIILKGDLEDKLFATVKQGDVLFEIGNPNNLRIELSVDDRDIHEIHVDPVHPQTGRFATNAMADDRFDFNVDRIIPVGNAKEGGNVFTVYGTIVGGKSTAWRPGMAGEARVNVEKRRLVWIWTHRLVDFLKLKTWM